MAVQDSEQDGEDTEHRERRWFRNGRGGVDGLRGKDRRSPVGQQTVQLVPHDDRFGRQMKGPTGRHWPGWSAPIGQDQIEIGSGGDPISIEVADHGLPDRYPRRRRGETDQCVVSIDELGVVWSFADDGNQVVPLGCRIDLQREL